MRFCLNKTGPSESSFIKMAINNKNGEKMTIAMNESIKSMILLIYFLYMIDPPNVLYIVNYIALRTHLLPSFLI